MPEPMPYAELHCHSHFSFLDGASSPAELVAEAHRLGLSALAITDHDGLHGDAASAATRSAGRQRRSCWASLRHAGQTPGTMLPCSYDGD
ncbi:DNA polymerase III subunit alpha [Kutzneria sp. 744]|nr:PHP domain-containing protein [Kutzneria sp. 744]EWM19791.1 DNA polymerase III subunit alpha [Kutzneria sp. 744]